MPGLRSSLSTGRTAAAPTLRSRSDVAVMAGECEPPLEKSTRSGNSCAATAGVHGLRFLGAYALLLALRRRRQQCGDLLPQCLVARRPAGLRGDDATERECRFRRRRPIDEGFGRPEVTGGTIGLAGLVAHVGGLLRIARRVRRDVAPQALEADGPHVRGGALARPR